MGGVVGSSGAGAGVGTGAGTGPQQFHKALQRGREVLVAVHHPVALALHGWQRGAQHHQPARLHKVLHHPARQAGHPQPSGSGVLDGLRAAQFDGALVTGQLRQQRLVGGLARARTRFPQQPHGAAQLGAVQRLGARRQRGTVRRCHQHQFVLQPRRGREQRHMAGAFDQTDVKVKTGDPGADVTGVANRHAGAPVGRCLRAVAQKRRQQRRQHLVANGAAGANAQRLQLLAGVVRHALDLVRAVQQRQRLRQQRAPVVVQQQPPAHAVKQAQRQQALQLLDGRAGGRLRQRQFGTGRRGAAGLRDGNKNLQLAQCQAKHVHRVSEGKNGIYR